MIVRLMRLRGRVGLRGDWWTCRWSGMILIKLRRIVGRRCSRIGAITIGRSYFGGRRMMMMIHIPAV